MRKSVGLLMVLLLVAACGCVAHEEKEERGVSSLGALSALREASIVLEDGRNVTCVYFDGGYAGGVSCDWRTD